MIKNDERDGVEHESYLADKTTLEISNKSKRRTPLARHYTTPTPTPEQRASQLTKTIRSLR